MCRALVLTALFCVLGSAYPQPGSSNQKKTEASPHGAWDALLKAYVREDGMVDYKGFLKDRVALETYLGALKTMPPNDQWTQEAKLAYYINLYNAGTVALILDHYPLKSIRDIDRPWGKKRIRVGTREYSLGDIEHKILRKMGDARIHFAINCASISCPQLPNWAFTAQGIDTQLQRVAQDFINDNKRNIITAEKAQVSKIFKWFRSDFESGETSLIAYLNAFLEQPIAPQTPMGYLPYDWSLNDSDP
jgi:hypothetical protein